MIWISFELWERFIESFPFKDFRQVPIFMTEEKIVGSFFFTVFTTCFYNSFMWVDECNDEIVVETKSSLN